jgi:hypothetical protein
MIVEIGSSSWQANGFDARRLKNHIEIFTEQAGAIMDEIPIAF